MALGLPTFLAKLGPVPTVLAVGIVRDCLGTSRLFSLSLSLSLAALLERGRY